MRKLVAALVCISLMCAYVVPSVAYAAGDDILDAVTGTGGEGESAQGTLDEMGKKKSLEAQRRAARSKYYSEMGRKLYQDLKYEEAEKILEKALEIDPGNKEATRYLSLVRTITNTDRLSTVKDTFSLLKEERKVKIQELILQLQNLYDRGLNHYKAAENPAAKAGSRGKEAMLANSIRDCEAGIEALSRGSEIIRWMPYQVDLSSQKKQVKDLTVKCRSLKRARIAQIEALKKDRAYDEAKTRKAVEADFERKKIRKLLDQCELLFDQRQYIKCERLAKEIRELDPTNAEANRLYYSARANKHLQRDDEIAEVRAEEKISLDERLEEATVPWSYYLVYPDDWEEIKERETLADVDKSEPQWKKDIRRQLDRRVTFEFVDTPLEEAINFLQTLTKVNMILDPAAFSGGGDAQVPITLKVSDMELGLALKWILRLAELDYTLKNEAVFISTPENLAGEVDLKIYDVRDLTESITQFPGPEIVIGAGTAGGSGAGGIGGILTAESSGGTMFEASSLAEMIQTRIKPDSWAAEFGTSIEDRDGRLVVMQRPEIHRLIDQLLRSLRESQTLQVIVQARFLEVRDEFLEEIGVQFTDLPNTLGLEEPMETGGLDMDDDHPTASLVDPAGLLDDTYGGPPPVNRIGLPSGFQTDDTIRSGEARGLYDYRGRTQYFHARNNPFGSRLSTATPMTSPQGAVFQFRYVSGIQVNAILQALTKEENGEELMAPKLTMYNNQRAHLLAAHQRAYISDYNTSGGIYEPVVDTLLEGTVLDVRPTVSHDRRYVTLELRPGNARLTNMRRVNVGGGLINLAIQLPVIEFRSVRTTVTVPDGGTILMSGLMTDSKFDAHDGIPFLSDLPVLGRLFGYDLKQRFKRNLLIVVSAQLILFDEEESKL